MFRLPLLSKIQFTNLEWVIVPRNKLIITTQVKFLKCRSVFILLIGKKKRVIVMLCLNLEMGV